MTVEIDGPAGRLVTVGATVDSHIGGLAMGSRQVEPNISAALPGLRRATGRAAAVGCVALVASVAGLAARGWFRRHA
ncbi:hypothetical protein [Parafrankia discariae]|uniref:hypothetical protein n=1 Tax=Parafrankia discariae TaxID=365528 RepID=UPI000361976B|nr:hypothetical protein [Parafrankia discariae]